jgi:tripartite-type tricarboxylate transporter receptor subunit TctC
MHRLGRWRPGLSCRGPVFLTAVVAPAGTPKSVIAKLRAEVQRIVALSDVHKRLTTLGAEPPAMRPADPVGLLTAIRIHCQSVIKFEIGNGVNNFV